MSGLTYKKAGVDIDKANKFVGQIRPMVRATFRSGVLTDIGAFGALFDLKKTKYKDPVLASSTDGVGTKLKLAFLNNKHDTVGIDLVAMGVNDILSMRAEPIFFLDYISTGKLKPEVLIDVVKGIARGCRQAGCALVGGETAEMPGIYNDGEYDLAGFCVGLIERKELARPPRPRPGDIILGLASSGLHSNGFSLVRRLFSQSQMRGRLSRELLRPTRIYVKPVLALKKKFEVKGIANITGGGFYDNLPRILPKGLSARIDKGSWPVPEIFKLIQKRGNIKTKEMFRTFNMGIGMALVLDKRDSLKAKDMLSKFGLRSWVIGRIAKDKEGVSIV